MIIKMKSFDKPLIIIKEMDLKKFENRFSFNFKLQISKLKKKILKKQFNCEINT